MAISQKIIAILLTFIGRQIFLRVLTVEYLGINTLFSDILSVLSLADMGMATAMAYSFYKPLSEKDEDKLAALIGFYNRVYNVIAMVVATAGLALLPFLRYIINLENDIQYIEIYYLISLATIVVSYLFVYKSTIITADQNRSVILKYRIGASTLNIVLQIVVLITLGNFMAYCSVTFFTTLASNILISRKASNMYPFIKRKIKLGDDDKRAVFQNMSSMVIYKFANTILVGSDNIIISVLIGTAIVGKYSNYMLAVSNLSNMSYILFTSLSASIGNLIVMEAPEKRLQVFKVMQMISYWIGGFLGFCLFFLLDDFVYLWIGREFIFDLFTKSAILLYFYLIIAMYPVTAFREATGMYQKTKYVMLIAAILKITLAIILGTYLGLPGIILANFISKILTYAWYEPKILFRDFFDSSAVGYLFGHILNLAVLTTLAALIHFFFPWGESSGWLEWLMKSMVYAVIINTVYFFRYFRTKEFRIIINKALGLIKKK